MSQSPSPLHKLMQLKRIQEELRAIRPGNYDKVSVRSLDRQAQLLTVQSDILASVGAPPEALFGNDDPGAWSNAFAEAFPDVAADQAYGWFVNAMLASHNVGVDAGAVEGAKDAAERLEIAAGALDLMLGAIRAGSIRCNQLISISEEGGKPRALSLTDYLIEKLAIVRGHG